MQKTGGHEVYVIDEPAADHRVRPQAMIGIALLGLVVVGVGYLQPSLDAARAPSPGPPRSVWQIDAASFAEAERGTISVREQGGRGSSITFVTSDGGRTWTRPWLGDVTIGFQDIRRALAVAQPPGRGVWASEDGGRTWRRLGEPPALEGAAGRPVFLDAGHGWWLRQLPIQSGREPRPAELWRTADGGRSWRRLSAEGIPAAGSKGQPLFVDPERGAILLVPPGTRWPSLLVTRDGGERWGQASLPASPTSLGVPLGRGLLARGSRLVAWVLLVANDQVATSRSVTIPARPAVAVVTWTSEDAGLTWGPAASTPLLSYAGPLPTGGPFFDDRGRLLLLVGHRLWTSEDGGLTWTGRVVQAPSGVRPITVVSAIGPLVATGIRLDRTEPAGMVLGSQVLLRSRDGGVRWEEIALPRKDGAGGQGASP